MSTGSPNKSLEFNRMKKELTNYLTEKQKDQIKRTKLYFPKQILSDIEGDTDYKNQIEEYLKKGGKVTKLGYVERSDLDFDEIDQDLKSSLAFDSLASSTK